MIEVTPKAQEKIDRFFEQNPEAPVRVQVGEGSCCGQCLGIAVDELKEGDHSYVANGVTYVIAGDLSAQLGRITIDFVERDGMSWFQLTPENPARFPDRRRRALLFLSDEQIHRDEPSECLQPREPGRVKTKASALGKPFLTFPQALFFGNDLFRLFDHQWSRLLWSPPLSVQ